jgi:outer membrane protein OmpA-like peptidoglycan-associated protein
LVIFFVIAIVLYTRGHAAGPAAAPVAAAAPATTLAVVTETVTVVIPDGASIRVVGGVVNFYFATASADLAPGAAEALAAVIKGVEGGHKAVVSGFHDTTGDAATNEALAKKRAETVRDVLTGLGVPADKVELQRPAVTAGSGNDAEARRVEVKLVD